MTVSTFSPTQQILSGEFAAKGDSFRLDAPLAFDDAVFGAITVADDFAPDGASIPRLARPLIDRWDSQIRRAAGKTLTWSEAADVLGRAMKASGADSAKVWMVVSAVKLYGKFKKK